METNRPVCSICGTHLPSFDGDTEPKVVDSMGNQNTAFCPRCQCLVTAVIQYQRVFKPEHLRT